MIHFLPFKSANVPHVYEPNIIPIKGVALNFPLSADVRLKSHSAAGNTNDSVVVLIAQAAYIAPHIANRYFW